MKNNQDFLTDIALAYDACEMLRPKDFKLSPRILASLSNMLDDEKLRARIEQACQNAGIN